MHREIPNWKICKGEKMLKGELGEEAAVATATFIFVTTILVVLGIIGLMLMNVESSLKTVRHELDVADVSHIIKSCLSQDSNIDIGSVTEGDEIKDDEIDDCGFTGKIAVRIKDFETGKEWGYGSLDENPYTVYATLLVNGERHMGEISVTYK